MCIKHVCRLPLEIKLIRLFSNICFCQSNVGHQKSNYQNLPVRANQIMNDFLYHKVIYSIEKNAKFIYYAHISRLCISQHYNRSVLFGGQIIYKIIYNKSTIVLFKNCHICFHTRNANYLINQMLNN